MDFKINKTYRLEVSPTKSVEYNEVVTRLRDFSYQLFVWYRDIPFRKGLNVFANDLNVFIHTIIDTDKILSPIPSPSDSNKIHVVLCELDGLKDGQLYIINNIYERDGEQYANVDVVKEIEVNDK